MKLNKEKTIETLFLLIFVGIMLWIGLADSWGHKIEHGYPYSYLASDTFQHQTRAQWIKDTGNYKYEAPYYSAGLTNVVGFYPPILHHATVLFSHASGLEVYDAILLLTVLFAITGALVMYHIIEAWNKHVAMLSLPITTYLFTIREARVAFYWGHWPALLGDFFLLATLWMLSNLSRTTGVSKRKTAFFIGLFLAGTALGHTAATIFATIFIVILFFVSHTFKKFDKQQFKTLIYGIIIFLILTFNFLIMFKQTWMVAHPQSVFNIVTDWSGGGGFIKLTDFGTTTLTILIIGLALQLLTVTQTSFFPTLISTFAILGGLTNYIGFSMRAFNFRFYWPILLSLFFGTSATKLLRLITKPTTLKSATASLAITILLVVNNYTATGPIEGLMNPYTWQTINWLKDNTPNQTTIFFFYGDSYDQDGSLGNTQRRSTRVEINDLTNAIQKRNIERTFPTKELIESGTHLPYKNGLFKYGRHLVEKNISGRAPRDICSFDYYVFDKIGRYQPFTQLNYLIANTFAQNNFTMVFENPLSIILKNNKKGGTCIGTNDKLTF